MNTHNAALAKGLTPAEMANMAGVYGIGSAAGALAAVNAAALGGGLLGEGGPATKPHREL
jgi:hypothetical protein